MTALSVGDQVEFMVNPAGERAIGTVESITSSGQLARIVFDGRTYFRAPRRVTKVEPAEVTS
jgi:hypothetical protein